MKGDWTRSHPFVSVCGLPCSTNLCPGNGVTSQSLRNRVGVTKGKKSEQGHMDNLCLLYNLRPHNIDFTCAFHVGVVGPRLHRRCMYLYRDYRCPLCTKMSLIIHRLEFLSTGINKNRHCRIFVVLTAGMRPTALLISRSLSMEGLCSQGTRLNESPRQRNGPRAPLLRIRMCCPLVLSGQRCSTWAPETQTNGNN